MDKPTDEQVKEFWEWCGLRCYVTALENLWVSPSGKDEDFVILPKDLNSLFKFAVPTIINYNDYFRLEYNRRTHKWDCQVGLNVRSDKDTALALFWAIYGIVCNNTSDVV